MGLSEMDDEIPDCIVKEIAEFGVGTVRKCDNAKCDNKVVVLNEDYRDCADCQYSHRYPGHDSYHYYGGSQRKVYCVPCGDKIVYCQCCSENILLITDIAKNIMLPFMWSHTRAGGEDTVKCCDCDKSLYCCQAISVSQSSSHPQVYGGLNCYG